MNKMVDIVLSSLLILVNTFVFSSGAVYFIKNVREEDSFYLSILLTLLIINFLFVIEQYKSLKKLYKDG